MKTRILIFFSLITIASAFGQNLSPALTSLVEAERKFSNLSKTDGVKKAFLSSFDPSAVYFRQAVKVDFVTTMSEQPDGEGQLLWEPIYADIASSEDFGYTTGPFYFYKAKGDTQPVGNGYYSSVWKKNEKGEWKVIMDLGIGIPEAEKNLPSLSTSSISLKSKSTKDWKGDLKKMMDVENKYSEKLNTSTHSYDQEYLSKEVRAYRPGRFPFVGLDATLQIPESDKVFSYKVMDGYLSTSGDLGFTYGTVDIKVTKDTGVTDLKAVYYRVWKKENGKDWKIVLDVIGFT